MPRVLRGQVYIGLIISMGLLTILSQTIISLVLTSYETLTYTDARANAKQIATEQMETIRNLPYNSVGTVGGIPSGTLPQNLTVSRNGLNYTVKITIIYIDDPFDGTAPNDLLPTDYKRVRVDVSWGGIGASRGDTITLITDVAPNGVETTNGGGTLMILVFDSSGKAVPQANVNIVATSVNPPVNLTITTDINGLVILPGALPCNSCYQITVTKTNYSTDRTYSTAEVINPAKPWQSVLQSQLTQVSFAIDSVSTLQMKSTNDRASGFSPLASQQFRLRGSKTIGTDSQGLPVYKYDQTLTTDGSGNLTLNNMEWDTYQFTSLNSSYNLSGSYPLLPVVLNANTTLPFSFSLTSSSSNSLLTIFTDPANNPISSVSASISTGALTATASSGLSTNPDFGQAFFSSLQNVTYQLLATVSGYLNYSGTVNVIGSSVEKVIMTPQ
ncbi:carboxypeptidase regulatory-like domain-containing protein [Candidatus Woesebacteria bacterium]|nr:carboxypeptidase regulatory-like domain-containing protein [Candidatus Woesebacteria bacterium]QQG47944.1 MAG: carboxypeptidase regulatory-like domain-containing protein [Candidatus Woesebacteria bacterium]